MPIANCKRCGRIFNKLRREICMACIQEEDKWFVAVKNYLHEHRDATLAEVEAATDVRVEYIVDMIRDGRLILRDHPNMFYPCDRCGSPTSSGRFCASCARALSQEMGKASSRIDNKGNEGGKGYHSSPK